MARSIRNKFSEQNLPNIFADLALLGSKQPAAEEVTLDLRGTAQEPPDFNGIVPGPLLEDAREQQYLAALHKVGQLPLAMSENEQLRQDAADAMGDTGMDNQLDWVQQLAAANPRSAERAQKRQQSDVMANLGNYLQATKGDFESPESAQAMQNAQSPAMQNLGRYLQETKGDFELDSIMQQVMKDPSLMEGLSPEVQAAVMQGLSPDMQMAVMRKLSPKLRGALIKILSPDMQAALQKENMPSEGIVGPAESQKGQAEGTQMQTVPFEQPITEEMVEGAAGENNMQPGSVQLAESDQKLMQDLQSLSKNPIPPEQMAQAKKWEDLSQKSKDQWNAEEQALVNNLKSGNLSTFDKIALGIAIAVPILIALRYGPEAGLITAAHGLNALSGTLNPDRSDSMNRLQEIQKARLANQEKDIEISKKITDQIPDKDVRSFLKGKDIKQVGNDVGISTGDESGVLWLDGKKFEDSNEGAKRAREVTKEADETIGIMKDSNKVIDEVLDILDQIPQDSGLWEAVKKNAQWFTGAAGHNPFGGKGPEISIMGPDGKIRKVDAFGQLKQKIALLQDLYNKQVLGGTRLTGNVVTHWGGVLGDPTKIQSWLSQDLEGFKNTARSLKDVMNSREVENLVGKGFLRKPLAEAFPSYQHQILSSEENVLNSMRKNPKKFRDKVK